MTKLDLDSDLIKEVRVIEKVKKKWSLSDIILPIKNTDSIILKKIEDTTTDEFFNWLKQVMPFTPEMIKVFAKGNLSNNIEEKINLFEIIVLLHTKKWLFAMGESVNKNPETKWS